MNAILRGLLLFALLALPVTGASQSAPPSSVSVEIEVRSGYGTSVSFSVTSARVAEGGTVTWHNTSSRPVQLSSSGAGMNRTVAPNASASHSFSVPGGYGVQAAVGGATAQMNVDVVARNAQPGEDRPLQEFVLLHSLSRTTIYPGTVVVRQGIPVRFVNVGLEGLDFHGPVQIREPGAAEPAFQVVGDFTATPGQRSVAEFTPDRTGTFEITHAPHGHPIAGTLIVVEDYPAVFATLQELGLLELAALHSLAELSVFPAELFAFEGLPLVLYNASLDGVHNPVQVLDGNGQPLELTVNGAPGATGFPVLPNALSVVEFTPASPGELRLAHEPHGHPFHGTLVVKEEE